MDPNPYQSPQTESPPPEITPPDHPGDPFFSAIKVGAVLQFALFVLTALTLDGGNKLCITAMIGYWIAVALIMIRRRSKPTQGDLLFLRYGVAGLFIITLAVAKLVYSIIGESTLSGWERWFR
jgi:hypothetical protein